MSDKFLQRLDEIEKDLVWRALDQFKWTAVDAAKNEESPTRVLVLMKPSEFLSVAAELTDDTTRGEGRKGVDLVDVVFDTIPELRLARESDDEVKVVYHDGRHRAREIQRRGVELMPVVIKTAKGVLTKPRGPVMLKDDLPSALVAEDNRTVIPFPFGHREL